MNKYGRAISKIAKKQHKELPALSYKEHRRFVKEFTKDMSFQELLKYKKWIMQQDFREKEKSEGREPIKKDGPLKKAIKRFKKLFQ